MRTLTGLTTPSFCVLLDSPVTFNGRAQRTASTLSALGPVLLVTSGGTEQDQALFDDRVEVKTTVRPEPAGLRRFVLLHRQNDQLADAALESGRKFDVVWANDYSTLHPARRIARATGAKLVYDSYEIWLETINQFFPRDAPQPKATAFRVIVALCRLIGRREEPNLAASADVVVTANESFARVLRERLGRDDIVVVMNTPEYSEPVSSNRIREELGLAPGDRIVLYQGMMNAGRALHELVTSAREFADDVKLVLLGHGVLAESLRQLVRELGLEDKVFLPGTVAQAELRQWTASADLGVLILDPINLSKQLASANKLFEYMAAGIPILTTDLPENRRIVDGCDCGWLISTWEPPVLARHIAEILQQPDEMERRGANGRRWFEDRYNWSIESKQVLAALSGLVPAAEAGRS
jgi:glycosyltransferase involved in cell wall biosynthesis